MKNVLITGGLGFIGFSLCLFLQNKKIKIDLVDKKKINKNLKKQINKDYVKYKNINLENYSKLKELRKDYDYIFHLAAFNGTNFFYKYPIEVINSNYKTTENLLNYFSRSYKLKKFIFSSTSEVYASTINKGFSSFPTNENVLLSIEDIKNPRWSYAASKILCEVMINSFKIKYPKFNYLIIRYHNVYGPLQKDHFIPEYLERLLIKKKNIIIGNDERSYIYIDDAIVHTYNLAIHIKLKNQIINIGNNISFSSIQIAEKITSYLNIKSKIIIRKSKKGSVKKRIPDITKLNKYSNYINQTNLEEGIKKILQYNYKKYIKKKINLFKK